MKIRTEFIRPPIPYRHFDWSAVDNDTYEPGHPIGMGCTKLAAIEDLMQQLEECPIKYRPNTKDKPENVR
jgi:hypothetical protein